MSLYGKGQLIGIGVIAAAVGVSQADKHINYTPVDAIVTKAVVDCYIESGNEKIVKKDTEEMAYMDCELAPFAAAEYHFDKDAIKKRTQLDFTFLSPVDGKKQKGSHTASNAEFKVGQKIQIYANKEKADKYRW